MSTQDAAAEQKNTATAFIDAINRHDVAGIVGLLSDAYEFVNSSGDHFKGRQFMSDEWADQFRKHPDYRIRVERTVADSDGVALFGCSEGTYAPGGDLKAENAWCVPAAFHIVSKGGKITVFESYSDASMVYDLMEAVKAEA